MRIDTAKSIVKDFLWGLPTPISRPLVMRACRSGKLNHSYSAYFKLDRPTTILTGPFKGMRYIPVAAGSSWMPKVLGTYEKELHPYIERACGEECDLIVDIGSAEGYYAIGLALRLPRPTIYAFDTDPRANYCLRRNARLNGVADRIVPGGFCTPEALNALLARSRHPLVICDCEGGEVDVLDPARAPELRRATMIVELHDYPGHVTIGPVIMERFGASHAIEPVAIVPRTRADMPASCLGTLSDAEVEGSIAEGRPANPVCGWAIFRPKP